MATDVATVVATINKTEEKLSDPHSRVPKVHAVVEKGVNPEYLEELLPKIRSIFKPSRVKYTNPNLEKEKSDDPKALHHKQVLWRASSYMEVDEAMGGAMQKGVKCDLEMLKLCTPVLRMCDEIFTKWYTELHGDGSIHKLKRLQSFVTRYKPVIHENGLVRHVDGAQIDGSVVMGLPTPYPFTGGGLTVWEGTPGTSDEVSWHYPINPGDVCLLDNFVYHQGDAITSGERWALVIFYRCKALTDHTQHRWGRVLTQFAKQHKGKQKDAPSSPSANTPVSSDKESKSTRVFSDQEQLQAIGAVMLALLAQADWQPAVRSVLDDHCSHVTLHAKLSATASGEFKLSHNILVMRVSRALKSAYFNPKARHLKAMIHSLVVKGLIRRNAVQARNFEFVPATDKKVGNCGSNDGTTETVTASSNASGSVEEVPAVAAAASSKE